MTPSPEPHATRGWWPAAVAAILAGGLAACATTPMPLEELAVARSAVANAVSAGSEEFSPGELLLARDKLARAQSAAARDEPQAARALAEQAQADAQLAAARSRAAKAERTVAALQGDSRALQEEMQRKSRAVPMSTAPSSPRTSP